MAPLPLVAVVTMFDGQSMLTGGATTVMVKLQLVVLPQASLAVAVTVVVPMGKVLPPVALALTDRGEQPPPAVMTK